MVKKVLKWVVMFGIAMCVFVWIYAFTVIANTPKIDPDNIYDYLPESSVLLDDQGEVIESLYLDGSNRTNISYDEMPEDLINAVVAIEDKTFWKHHGFNITRIFGAIKESLTSGGGISGTSTITQQLARNVYLSETKSVRSLSRKISEAYYTVILESNLTKEEIMEAYLNSIYLGNNSYGVQSAAQSYYNKDAKDLDLVECVSLAALPKAPDSYALVKKRDAAEGDAGLEENQPIIYENSDYIYYYNGDASKDRREATLRLMEEQGYITAEEHEKALATDLKDKLDVVASSASSGTSYFVDYMIEQVTDDLIEKYNYTAQEAREKIYSGGLRIYTSLNSKAQKAVEDAFANNYNFPSNTNINYDGNGNIIGSNGQITLYDYDNYFNSEGTFTLSKSEYKESDGNLILLAGKRLNFYSTSYNGVQDYNIEFKDMYEFKDGALYSIEGGVINVPAQYKSLDEDGNLVIDSSFFGSKDQTKGFFVKSGDNYTVDKSCYTLRASVRQPQAAMVITDYKTGEIKAMVGGRGTSGRMLYNRAINPRQPGSSIKPLAIYSSALQQGYEAAEAGTPMSFTEFDSKTNSKYYGDYWTASSGINDAPIKYNGKDWPKNWYDGYKGEMTMRKAVEQSVNTTAVRVYQQVGSDYAIEQLKKFGISTVVEDGSVNDKNPSALALGGMTKGISPLEMSGAFGTIANGGTRVDSITYTKVEDKHGELMLETDPQSTEVLDEGVAFVTQDILRTTVTNGIAANAQVSGQTTAGKTGTTSDSMDIWFCGFTPQYSAALWIGNDVNITIDATSDAVASLWSTIMTKATSGMDGSLKSQPDNVKKIDGEYYVTGTEAGRTFDASMDEEKKKKEEEEKKKKEEEEKKKAEEEAKKEQEQQQQQEQQTPPDSGNTGETPDSGNTGNTGSDSGQTPVIPPVSREELYEYLSQFISA